jgi:hypothetical protein
MEPGISGANDVQVFGSQKIRLICIPAAQATPNSFNLERQVHDLGEQTDLEHRVTGLVGT